MGKHANLPNTLEHKVVRWETRHEEHKSNVKDVKGPLAPEVPPTPAPAKRTSEDVDADVPQQVAKRRKVINHRRNDPPPVTYCVDIANAHISKSQTEKGVFPSASFSGDQLPDEPAGVSMLPTAPGGNPLAFHSNAKPLSEFNLRWQKEHLRKIKEGQAPTQTILLSEPPPAVSAAAPVIFKVKQPLPQTLLEGETVRSKLESMFSQSRRFYNKPIDADAEAIEIPTDSRWHIRKLLVLAQPNRPFTKCLNSKFDICHAARTLQHPAAPDLSMIAYYNEKDYVKVCHGEKIPSNVACNEESLKGMVYENFCEFCYRISIQLMVEASKHDNHRASVEAPNRYYMVGAGEYSTEGMFQQAEKGKVRFSHGIIGAMRIFKTTDFMPAMFRFSPSQDEVLEILHYDEYCRRRRARTLPNPEQWIPGWEEMGPFYQHNENAFLEVKQIDPYTRVFSSTAREFSVATILEDYFERQRINHPLSNQTLDYAHLFWPMVVCWWDEQYLKRPYYRWKHSEWKRFCIHSYEEPPDPATHKLYYILLMKINSLRQLVFAQKFVSHFTKHIIQKIQVYLTSYHPLLKYVSECGDFSDAALLQCSIPEPRLGVNVSPLLHYYPLAVHHHRNNDYFYTKLATTVRKRNNPLQICSLFYTENDEQRRSSPSITLYNLPNEYNLTGNYEMILEGRTPMEAIEIFEQRIVHLFDDFQQNVSHIKSYGTKFPWKDPALKKQRKQFIQEATAAEADDVGGQGDKAKHEKKALRQRKATLRAFKTADETILNNFKQVQQWVDQKTSRYNFLLDNYQPLVLCEFNETVSWLRHCNEPNLDYLLKQFDSFVKILPTDKLNKLQPLIRSFTVQTWKRHLILFALLLRVSVMEELHNIEPYDRSMLRYNLILLRNSHLKLFRKIAETPGVLLQDTQLLYRRAGEMSILDLCYPHPTRELHQGCIPDYANSLEMVNFFADCGMDHFPWSKLQYKMPDRCCDVREFSEMLRNYCQDPTLYRWTLLVLRLSLGGLFEHCTVVPSFARSLILDELFDNATHSEMKPTLIQFILNNEALVLNAISESLCYQLELMPGLLQVLRELYRDWFSWRVYANMDMIRYLFTEEGNFQSVQQVVFERVHLKSMRTIFRLWETDFVVWTCNLLKKSNDNRYKTGQPELPSWARLSTVEMDVIQNFIYQHGPDEVVDARSLAAIMLDNSTLELLSQLHGNFLFLLYKNSGKQSPIKLPASALLTMPKMIAAVQALHPKQFVRVWHYFTLLRNYQSVRVIRLTNAAVLRQQKARIWETPTLLKLGHIPKYAFCCAFSLCCRHVKNSWSLKPGAPSTGFEDVFHNMEDDIYTCAKRSHRFTVDGRIYDVMDEEDEEEDEERQNDEDQDVKTSKSKRKSDRELCKPDCSQIEIFTIPLLGVVVEADTCRIPGAKRAYANKDTKLRKPKKPSAKAIALQESVEQNAQQAPKPVQPKKSRDPPIPGYWLTACCGIPSELDESRNTPAGYCCKSCSTGILLYESFMQRLCSCCRRPAINYHIVKLYDDCFTWCFRRLLLCTSCYAIGKRLVIAKPIVSFIFTFIKDPQNSGDLLQL